MSLAVQLLVLPMYAKADAMQDRQREKEKQMKHWVDHIKSTFKGDEKYMMLQTYYRLENYKPISSVMGSLSLLLQIPFFIAAYNYLSHLTILAGVSYYCIPDLSKPDQIIQITDNFALNLLPILMTVFNIISGIIYTKGFPWKDKLQTYGLAILFLVLLYDSPSGLVFYWTLNNLFSLLKNVYMKLLHNNRSILNICSASFGGLVALYYIIRVGIFNGFTVSFLMILLIAGFTPAIISGVRKLQAKSATHNKVGEISKEQITLANKIFHYATITLAILLGGLIPLSVVSASPLEFMDVEYGPMGLILYTLPIYIGIFVLWCRVFYMLSSDNGKRLFAYGMAIMALFAAINFLCFGRNLGTVSTKLVYDKAPQFTIGIQLLNSAVIVMVILVAFWLYKKRPNALRIIYQIMIVTFSVLTVYQSVGVVRKAATVNEVAESEQYEDILPLSKNGKNVIVFMLDRAISGYIPFIFQEKPELKEMYDGFTYYPNTISYGCKTNYASPALYGGYEYTPTKINERANISLKDKHNEALTVLPRIFAEKGFQVVVTDPPYANYSWFSDLSIYNSYEGIEAYNLTGCFSDNIENHGEVFYKVQKHNFLYYSLMKAMPIIGQNFFYDAGHYLSAEASTINDLLPSFIDNYTVLTNLTRLTAIKNDDSNNFLLMQNATTHEPVFLQRPEYIPTDIIEGAVCGEPEEYVVNGRYCRMETDRQITHYQVNVGALLRIGEWLDYLKQQGVYDNTRIIIVADHGECLGQFDELDFTTELHDIRMDVQYYNPLLLYKDFNATGFETNDEFMTNADTPILAMEDLIENPVNPYSGNLITNQSKFLEPQIITTSDYFDVDRNNGNKFNTLDGCWYSVEKNIFDVNNWKKIGEGSK